MDIKIFSGPKHFYLSQHSNIDKCVRVMAILAAVE